MDERDRSLENAGRKGKKRDRKKKKIMTEKKYGPRGET
jgi:hypothetical protein